MKEYQDRGDLIIRTADGANIPFDVDNRDYRAYINWVNAGNVADPVQPPPVKTDRASVIAQIESEYDSTIVGLIPHGGNVYRITPNSKEFVMISMYVASRAVPKDFALKPEVGPDVPMTFPELQAFCASVGDFYNKAYTLRNAKISALGPAPVIA